MSSTQKKLKALPDRFLTREGEPFLFLMEYSITAKVTTYCGIVFRSKLEARCYDYLINIYPSDKGYEIHYEPKIIRSSIWNPDFGIWLNSTLVHLVEVKPLPEMFDIIKYTMMATQEPDLPTVLCMDQSMIVEFIPDGGFRIKPYNELIWKQTFNNIK